MREQVYFNEHNKHDEDKSLKAKTTNQRNSKRLMMALRLTKAPMTSTRILKTASAMPRDFKTVP